MEGQNLTFLYQNAQGDVGNARNIAEKFLADGVDVLTPCTTPNVQATVRVAKGGKTPVVFACVTDPVAAGILAVGDAPVGHQRHRRLQSLADRPSCSTSSSASSRG